MSDDIARRPQIRISVRKRRQNSGNTSGASASSATTTENPAQYTVPWRILIGATRPAAPPPQPSPACGGGGGTGPATLPRPPPPPGGGGKGGGAAAPLPSFRGGHEQAGRPEQQRQDQHDKRYDDRLRRADPQRGVGFQQADEDRGEDRAAEIAHAADHDDDERLQHPVEPHCVVDPDQRP